MTPWAELLLNPITATDITVRRRYHELARVQHPDRGGAEGKPGPRWYALATAYSLIKAIEARVEWQRTQSVLANVCQACGGSGVTIKRLGKGKGVTICTSCNGEGRFIRPERVKPIPKSRWS